MQTPKIIQQPEVSSRTPRIIHQTWKSKVNIPPKLQAFQQSVRSLHPNYEFRLYDDNDLRNIVQETVPQYLEKYDSFGKNIERVDFARYAMLYKYGGIYLDMDISSLKPLDDFVNMNKVVFGTEPKEHMRLYPGYNYMVCNAVMISPPGERVWMDIMKYIVNHYSFAESPVPNTGPIAVTKALKELNSDPSFDKERIVITKPCVFYPQLDNGKISSECDIKESYTIHHWENSWCWTTEKTLMVIYGILLLILVLYVFYIFNKSRR